MTACGALWFENDDPRGLMRWSAAGIAVVCAHAILVTAYLFMWQAPNEEIGNETSVISIELTAPQINQIEQPMVKKPIPPKRISPEAVKPEEKPAPKVKEPSPAPRTTVRELARAPRIDPTWQSLLLRRLQEFKNYPAEARRRKEQGVALLAFSVDRNGRVVSRHILRGSGHADLDAEALALVERAQPLPAFPPSMREGRLNLTVPIRFWLR